MYPRDPLKVCIDAQEIPDHPFDNPSQCYTLVLLAPFVVWGYVCEPFINEQKYWLSILNWYPGKHFYSKIVSGYTKPSSRNVGTLGKTQVKTECSD